MAQGKFETITKKKINNEKTDTTVSVLVEQEVIDGKLQVPEHAKNPGVITNK